MGKKTNLELHGNTWRVTVSIPVSLRSLIGKSHFKESLNTSDLDEAARLKHEVVGKFKKLIATYKKNQDALNQSTIEIYNNFIREVDAGLHGTSKAEKKEALESALLSIDMEADEYLSPKSGVELDPETGHRYDLDESKLDEFRKARRAIETGKETLTVSKLLEHYLSDQDHLQPSTLKAVKNNTESFISWLGHNKEPRKITKHDAVAYYTEKISPLTRATKTKKGYIGHISAFFSWCELRHYCEDNPFRGLSRLIKESTRGSTKKVRRPYKEDELLHLLKTMEPLTSEVDSKLWSFTLIGLYTGMRLNEIAELSLKDIHREYIYVRAGKTHNAVRNVPIHPLIKPLITKLKASSNDSYLIHSLKRGGDDNKRGHYLSKRFGHCRTKKAKLIDNDHRLDFHSLRHNMKTALRDTGLAMSLIDEIMGHDYKDKRPNDVYLHQADIKILANAIKKVNHGKKLERYLKKTISNMTLK